MEVRAEINIIEVFSPSGVPFATFKIAGWERAKAEARTWRRAKWIVRLNGINLK